MAPRLGHIAHGAMKSRAMAGRSPITGGLPGARLTIYTYSPFRSARGAPRGTLLGSLPLWGRAWIHEAVAATGIDFGPTHGALLHRARGLPLASVRPGRITGIDVRVDIGLCVGRHHPDG